MKIYLACALTHVPSDIFPSYCAFLHRIATALGSAEPLKHEVRYSLAHSDPKLRDQPPHERPRQCYLLNRQMVESADVVIAEVSFPSTGVGIELQIADANLIPILLCFREIPLVNTHPVYYLNPDQSLHQLQVGESSVSLMALGLPSVRDVVRYVDEDNAIIQILAATKKITHNM